jgi:S-(hydroxymethyl)glutathione dehydrogenase/alcohol dehydrogenase
MRAAVFTRANEPLTIEDVSPVDPGPDDVVVRLTASGICHTDRSRVSGDYPSAPGIFGHEGVGIVEWVGSDVRRVRVGDRVVGSLIPTCDACWYCHHDQAHLCTSIGSVATKVRAQRADGTELVTSNGLGTFAEALTASQDSLVKVETDLPDEQLALLGCAVTTGVSSVLEIARVTPGSTVVVLGCGGVGQAVVQGARLASASRIFAVDPVPWKLAMASKLGATDVLDPTEVDVLEIVRQGTGGRGADYAFDVVGSASTVRQSVDVLRFGGHAVAIGMLDVSRDLALPAAGFLYGKHFCGAPYGGSQVRREFPRLIELVERGLLDVDAMVSDRIGLEQINQAFTRMDQGEVIRTVILQPV